MRGPQAPEYIRKLAVYVPGKPIEEVQRELGVSDIVKLASNENPLGTSPKALAAIREALPDLHRYPDGGGYALRKALAARHAVDIDQVILGNGSCELIEIACRAYLEDRDEAVISQQSFVMYELAIDQVNARPTAMPTAPGRRHDLDAMAGAITSRTKLVFVANPCNPTGTYNTRAELDRLLAELGPNGWQVISGHHLEKSYTFPDFSAALAFVNRVGAVAEEQGHHPDLRLSWGKVDVTIHTHKVDGLTESDFVLAAKIDSM